MSTVFDEIIDRTGTASEKWDRYAGRDVLPLWVAEMDFRAPPAVIEALNARVAHGVFGYTHPAEELCDVIREVLNEDYSWRIEREWIVWLPGLVTGLNVACRAVGNEGDEVLTAIPVYPPFLSAPPLARRTAVTVPLREEDGRWSLDFQALGEAVTSRSRLFLLCNPHNPVGRAYGREELARLAEWCARNNLVICSDEIHAGLVLDADKNHIPIATLSPETASRTITLLAPSKTFNIPGLGCAFAVIPEPSLRRRFTAAMAGIVPTVNALGFTAALAAYQQGSGWQRELLAYLRGNRDLVEQEVARMPGLAVNHVEATYLAWIDTRKAGLADPAGFFEEAGVGLSDGARFGGPGFVRLNFGCPRSLLRQALDRMRKTLP
ncbi:putative C-S lyase [bacterium]|nr:putative C-S lyase [bacterium]